MIGDRLRLDGRTGRGGGWDGLIHVVGGQRPHHWHTLDGYPESTIDEVFALNFTSAFITSQTVAERGGRGGGGQGRRPAEATSCSR